MNLYEMFETVPTLETDGVWIAYSPDEDAAAFKLARAGGENRKYEQLIAKRLMPFRRLLEAQKDDPDPKTLTHVDDIMLGVWIETCLKDWKNVKDKETGEDLPFNKDNALKLFKWVPELGRDLREKSKEITTFRRKEAEEVAKN